MRLKIIQISLLFIVGCLLAACEKIPFEAEGGQGTTNNSQSNVVIRVVDLDAGWESSSSRSPVKISEVCSRLQFAVYQGATRVKYENQKVGDTEIGTFAPQLAPGIYQLLVLGHSGAANVTTTHPEKLQFTNPGASNGTGFTDTFYYYGEFIVDDDGADMSISMKRATSMFRLKTRDGKPADVKKFQFYYTGGSGALDAKTGYGCVNSKQNVLVVLGDSLTRQPLTFDMYTFLHEESGTVTFTINALDDNDNILYTREINAQMKRNCITQYTGRFFTNGDEETPDDPDDPDQPSDEEPPSSAPGTIYVDSEWANIFEYTF